MRALTKKTDLYIMTWIWGQKWFLCLTFFRFLMLGNLYCVIVRVGVVLKKTVVGDLRINVFVPQQIFSGLLSSRWSHNTNYWYSWVQIICYAWRFLYHKTTSRQKKESSATNSLVSKELMWKCWVEFFILVKYILLRFNWNKTMHTKQTSKFILIDIWS